MTDDRGGAFRWLFADRTTGRIIIAQVPNLLMWLFLAALATSFVAPAGVPARVVRIVQIASLALWGLDELARGVNPWRRFFGAGTLAGIALWLWVGN